MRILTWNILHGGGPVRIPEIALAIVGYLPDVVVLTEFRTRRGGQIRGVLADHGLVHQLATEPAGNSNGVLVASRWGLERLQMRPAKDEHKWLSARVLGVPGLGDVLVGGVHIADDSRMSARMHMWRHVVEVARGWAGERAVIAGDFNTGRHRVDEPGATFSSTAMLGTLCTLGFVDAWRLKNPAAREPSWVGPFGERLRIDAAFVSGSLKTRVFSGFFGHAQRAARVSDHSPLIVELERGGGRGGAISVENREKSVVFERAERLEA